MSYYPIGKAVPPPAGGSGGWGSQQGGAGGGWAPPPNAGGGWAPPTGSWAAPSGSWGGGGGGGYPPSTGGGAYPPNYPSSYPNQPPSSSSSSNDRWQPGMNQPSSGPFPSSFDRSLTPGNYPSGPGSGPYPPGGPPNVPYQPSGPGAYPPGLPSSNFGGGMFPPNNPPSYGFGGSNYPPGPSSYPSGPSSYPSGPSPYPSAPPSSNFGGGGVYPPGGSGYPPSQPGYPSFPGGQAVPIVTPQNVPTFNSGDVSDAYKQAIEYYKGLSDQDMIPDEGRPAFLALAGIDGAIDAYELQDILNRVFMSEFKFDGFGADMTRSLVAMRDYDLSGKLGFDGFRGLWTDLAWCKRTFAMFDIDKSGAFSMKEFTKALETMGLTVTPKTHKAMQMRYTDKGGNIRFDDFVLCYIRLKTMMTIYQSKDPQGQGFSDFERDEFVQLAIYS